MVGMVWYDVLVVVAVRERGREGRFLFVVWVGGGSAFSKEVKIKN